MKLDNKTFALILTGLLVFGGLGAYSICSNKQVTLEKFEKESTINAQTQIEKQKIIQEEKTKRTHDRMQWIPWANREGSE